MLPRGHGTREIPCRAPARICYGRFLCGRRCRDSSRAVAEVTGGTRGVGATRSEATEGRTFNRFADEGGWRVEWSPSTAVCYGSQAAAATNSWLHQGGVWLVQRAATWWMMVGGMVGTGHVREPSDCRCCGVRSWCESLPGGLGQVCRVAAAVIAVVSAAATGGW